MSFVLEFRIISLIMFFKVLEQIRDLNAKGTVGSFGAEQPRDSAIPGSPQAKRRRKIREKDDLRIPNSTLKPSITEINDPKL
jgi:hypothetical protein